MISTNATVLFTFVLILVLGSIANAASRYAVANGNWNATSTWAASSGGASGASVPVAGDDVFIAEGATNRTVTIPTGYAAACASVTIGTTADNTAGTLTFSASTSTLAVSGNVVMNRANAGATSTISIGAGSMTVNGNLTLANHSGSATNANRINSVTISTGALTIGGNLLFDGEALEQTQIVFSSTGTMNVGGSFTLTNSVGTLTPSTGTLNFNGSVAQVIPNDVSSISYNNLTISGSGAKTLGGSISITGNLTIAAGATLSLGSSSFTINVSADRSATINGTFVIDGTGDLLESGTGTKTIILNSGGLLRLTSTSSTFPVPNAYTVDANSTAEYSASGDQTIENGTSAPTFSYGHLTTSGSGTKTLEAAGGSMTINGGITIGSGTTLASNNKAITLKGNWTNNGSFTQGTSTLIMQGASAQTMSTSTTFNNLTIDNAAGVSLLSSETVSGTLTLTSGTVTTGANEINISNTAAAAVVATAGIIDGQITRAMADNLSTYIFNDASCTITKASGTNPTSVTMKSFPNTTVPYGNSALASLRYYTITPTGGAGAWDLTLSYRNAGVDERNSLNQSLFSLWRGNGSVWVDRNGTQSAATNPPNSGKVTSNGVTSFSDWTFAETGTLPIQLASFNGSALQNGDVSLTWVTLSEVNNYGFFVERKRPNEQAYVGVSNNFVPGHGTTNEVHTYTFTDLAPGQGVWMYRLKQVDLDGTIHYTEPITIDLPTSVTEPSGPVAFGLQQNYPNPFNPTTVIQYSIAAREYVRLRVYDMLGREISTLVDKVGTPGVHSVSWDASGFSAGIYLYRLEGETSRETKRMALLK